MNDLRYGWNGPRGRRWNGNTKSFEPVEMEKNCVKEPWEKELEKHDGPREALRLLAAEDARQDKLHELLETIREQIRLHVAPEHRPEGLFKNIQDAVYAMRGRTHLMDDAAITSPLSRSP